MADSLTIHYYDFRHGTVMPIRPERTGHPNTLNQWGQESTEIGSVIARKPVHKPDKSGSIRILVGPFYWPSIFALGSFAIRQKIEAALNIIQNDIHELVELIHVCQMVFNQLLKNLTVFFRCLPNPDTKLTGHFSHNIFSLLFKLVD